MSKWIEYLPFINFHYNNYVMQETASIDDNTHCESGFGATSGAAALVSGIIALALQARWEYNNFDHRFSRADNCIHFVNIFVHISSGTKLD